MVLIVKFSFAFMFKKRCQVVIMPPYGIKNPSERGHLKIFAAPKQLTGMAFGATWNFSSILGPRALLCPMAMG
ncbi:hypothetical protein OUZ56_002429 [Daphnia magna]|uniref:Uncharacterized protein n=1 Tax=Daphnia magna TaxID=35525 RepID=A0ABR0A5N4_9CRUS|nr:hypothetical protein OUZ56_002429 [Daphnia magna]